MAVSFTGQCYLEAKRWLLANDADAERMQQWTVQGRSPPATPEALASEVVWIILCAGRSAQAARTIEAKVWAAIRAGRPVVEAFGYRAKAAAIERAWAERQSDFQALQQVLATDDHQLLLKWCHDIPFVGDDTAFQLMKNFGAACVKPDIWMSRLAGIPDRPRLRLSIRFERCMDMANRLSAETSDAIPLIDSVAWLAANKGLLRVSFEPHLVRFQPPTHQRRSIFEPPAA